MSRSFPLFLVSAVLCVLFIAFLFQESRIGRGEALGSSDIAHPALEKNYLLDGGSYHQTQLLANFFEVAISKKVWPIDDGGDASFGLEDTEGVWGENSILKIHPRPVDEDLAFFLKAYPWMEDFLLKPRDFSYQGRIYKWNKRKVLISFDWPIYSKLGVVGSAVCGRSTQNCSFVQSIVNGHQDPLVEHIKHISSQLSALSGLDLNVVMPGAAEEKTADFARIRIIFDNLNEQKNHFKFHRFGLGRRGLDWNIRHKEYELKPAISFTTDVRSQVDGFIVLQEDKSIGLSVCKIMPNVGDALVRALVTECLVRALGLTDLLKDNSVSILGNWNAENNGSSFLKDLDGRSIAIKTKEELQAGEGDAPLSGVVKVSRDLSEIDRFLIKLLYCDFISSGDTKNMAEEKISACLKPN